MITRERKKTKVAVIGGGTAGCMAAAHITKNFPNFELYHIYASSIPTIGVGEGTQANFPEWLEKITDFNFYGLQKKCNVTRKFGIQFENWGVKHKQFMHNFYPLQEAYGYHISAAKLAELLKEHIAANYIDKKITNLKSNGDSVNITFEDNTHLEVDLAFDASGFPRTLDENAHISLSLIPTNAALIRQGPVVEFNSATRSIARPHGWIFVIPLTTHTSYGYVYNSSINSRSEIDNDFYKFLIKEKVTPHAKERQLAFPNFTSRTFFDGSMFKIGNAASFLEPLEATAINIAMAKIHYASRYPLKSLSEVSSKRRFNKAQLKAFNDNLLNLILKIALFIGWHYASGSCFDTDFWQFSKSNFFREIEKLENKDIKGKFEKYLQAGAEFNDWQVFTDSSSLIGSFGGFPVASFYEVGHGIGYFS
jgi:tryptophan halogenase